MIKKCIEGMLIKGDGCHWVKCKNCQSLNVFLGLKQRYSPVFNSTEIRFALEVEAWSGFQ